MRDSRKTDRLLWTLQWLLALFFALGSGAPKLFLPLDALPMPLPLPELFLRFVGVAEVLGGLGLILPGLLRIRPGLTPLAAAGLVLVTMRATVYQLAAGQPGRLADGHREASRDRPLPPKQAARAQAGGARSRARGGAGDGRGGFRHRDRRRRRRRPPAPDVHGLSSGALFRGAGCAHAPL